MKKLIIILSLFLSFSWVSPLYSLDNTSTIYHRELFHHWADIIHDGRHLNSRERILEKQSTIPVVIKNNRVIYGIWVCPYTKKIIIDERQIDIDHIVPLKYAWDHGASTWTFEKREEFANDLDNLMAVSFSANREKGDKGLNEWLPPNQDYQSTYIKKFNYICIKYGVIQ